MSDLLPERNIKMVTIILDNSTPAVMKDFRCSNCGKIAFQYYSELKVIVVGEVREAKAPHDVLCKTHDCKIMYRIT